MADTQADGTILLYKAGWQGIKVRFLMWLMAAVFVGSLYWGYSLALTYGTAPGDGGVLAPLGARIGVAAIVWVLGFSFAFGMWLFGRYYIGKLWAVPADRSLRIATYRFIGSRLDTVAMSEIAGATKHRDRIDRDDFLGALTGISVNAPYLKIRLRGRRWPLILDLQGLVKNVPGVTESTTPGASSVASQTHSRHGFTRHRRLRGGGQSARQ